MRPKTRSVEEILLSHSGTQLDSCSLSVNVDGFIANLQPADIRFAWTVGLIAWMALLAWLLTEHYFASMQPIPADMRSFGDRFVQAFGRPLVQRRVDAPPIQARLRFASRSKGLEILIAPTDGRTYPNLADHKSNLEYDVHRVLHLLGDTQFVSGALHAEGKWVVIPIIRRADLNEAGVK